MQKRGNLNVDFSIAAENPDTKTWEELHKLTSGGWVIGQNPGRRVTSLDEVRHFGAAYLPQIEQWLQAEAAKPPAPEPKPAATMDPDRLLRLIQAMPAELCAKVVESLEQSIGIKADGILASVPTEEEFRLPPGGQWLEPDNPKAGYTTIENGLRAWHPSPSFHQMADINTPEPHPAADMAPQMPLGELPSEREGLVGRWEPVQPEPEPSTVGADRPTRASDGRFVPKDAPGARKLRR